MKIKLLDGPFDGIEVEASGSGVILLGGQLPDGTELGEDEVARYTATRVKGEFRFRGWDTVVARLPLPGADRGVAVLLPS